MRYAALLLVLGVLCGPAHAQNFLVTQSSPSHGATGISLSDTVAFAFNREIDVSTDWNTEFRFEPNEGLSFNQVSLCLNFLGACAGGNDVPRYVRFQAQHEPNTDYTWLVYAVRSAGDRPMTEAYTVRYTTASTIGQGQISGFVNAPKAATAWTPAVRASLRELAAGLKRNGKRGRLVFDPANAAKAEVGPGTAEHPEAPPEQPRTHVGTIGAKAATEGPFTQILLIDEFSIREGNWTVRAADALIGSSGTYSLDFLRPGSYVPIVVRYTDGTHAEIDALGFHDPDGDGAPNAVDVDGNQQSSINLELFDFPLTTARNAQNLAVARDSAAQYADDQQLKIIQADYGMRPAGTAYQWTFRFHSPSENIETRVTIDPLTVAVDTNQTATFLTEMKTIPDGFTDSGTALQTALNDGGSAFIAPFRPRNLTTILQGGNLYWTDTPRPEEEFWRVRIIAISSGVQIFERYVDMDTGEILSPSQVPGIPDPPADLVAQTRDSEVSLGWAANTESDLADYRLYRSTTPATTGNEDPDPTNLIATIAAGTQQFSDTDVQNNQAYYYRLTAVDEDGNESATSNEVSAFPLAASVSVNATVSFGGASAVRDYRLVSLPGKVNTALASTLEGPAEKEWTAYWDDGSTDDFLVKFDGTSTFNFRPGRGFWLISTSAWTPSLSISTVDLEEDGTFGINLHDGWNIISNPFDVDVNWGAVQASNSITQNLWEWGGSFRETDAFESARNGEAFYFLNEQSLNTLKVPYPGAPGALAEAPPEEAASALMLEAYQEGMRVAAVRAGIDEQAHEGHDAYDQFAPPGYFEEASLRLVNESVDEVYSELATEYRPSNQKEHTFDLVLRANPGQPVEIRVSHLEAIAGKRAALMHPDAARIYDLHDASSVIIQPTSESTELKLLVGTAAFIDEVQKEALPETVDLLPNYPNPFQEQTTLTYALPEAQTIELTIYDILGRRVRTLIEREEQVAGVHRIKWDARNDAGQRASSGIYLARLRADDHVKVQRLVLVR